MTSSEVGYLSEKLEYICAKMKNFRSMKLVELQRECRYAGIACSGKRETLITRLEKHYTDELDSEQNVPIQPRSTIATPYTTTISMYPSTTQGIPVQTSSIIPTPYTTTIPMYPSTAQGIPVQTSSIVPAPYTTTVPMYPTLIQTNPAQTSSITQSQYTTTIPMYLSTTQSVPAQTKLVTPSQPTTSISISDGTYVLTNPQLNISTPHQNITNTQPSLLPNNYIRTHEMPITMSPISAGIANPCNLYNNVRDIIEVLPEFHPELENSLNADQFVKRITQLKDAYGWDDRVLLFAVQAKLKGPARVWLDNCRIFQTWQEFVHNFMIDFPVTFNIADIHIKMAETKRKPHETLQNYYFKMLSLGRKGELPECAIIKYIIRGINDHDFARSVASAELIYCNQLLAAIQRYVNYNIPRTNRTTYYSMTQDNANPKPNQAFMKTDRKNELICYNCSNSGHISLRCPEPQRRERCTTCLKTTHKSNDCPNKRNKTTTPTNVCIVEQSNPKAEKRIIKKIIANETEVEAFIDPGSNHTLIGETLARKLNDFVECNETLKGFAGGTYCCTSKIQLNLKIDEHSYDIWALVVRDSHIPQGILVGRDVLCQKGQRLIIEQDNCWVENNSKVDVNTNLNTLELEEFKTLLRKYRKCIAFTVQELGKCATTKMSIKLNCDEPIATKPYRLPFAMRPIVEKKIAELLQNGIIRQSESPYASPIVLVEKKNGESRMCVDYRRINKITIRLPYPMPNLEEQFALLSGNKYFTILDLKMGYHQIEMEESSKPYTAFITHNGHFEYNRMPFGLVNAPSVFQTLMNKLVKQLNPGEVTAYLDDIVIPSPDVATGISRLQNFLELLKVHGLTLRLDKCKFLSEEIPYLGHIVNKNGIRPGDEKLSAIKNFKTPTNVTEVRRFLGLTGFFRKFIENYSIITKPLTLLLKKNEKYKWSKSQQESFENLINLLCKKPVLALYDFNAEHEVHTDASSLGLAGVLLQSTDGRTWHPVSFYSRHCTEAESKYHSSELEVLAAVESLDRFRVHVLGKHIRLITDCAALAKVKEKTELNRRIARWLLRLLEYDVEFIHRAASRLAHVDALSREPDLPPEEPEVAGLVFHIATGSDDWLYTMQIQDESLREIIAVLRHERKNDQEKQIRTDYCLKNGRLYRKEKEGLKFVVPKAVRWRITQHNHDNHGHFGLEKTVARIKQNFWFPRIRKYVKEYLAACVDCCYNKARTGKAEA